MPAQASYGPCTVIFSAFHILRVPHGDPQVCHTAALWTRKGIETNQKLWKSHTGVVCSRTGPVRSSHGLFMGCLRYLNPYAAHKLRMHALKYYGPRTGRQNSYGATRGPCVSGRTVFVQNGHWTAREQPSRDPGLWCDRGDRSMAVFIDFSVVLAPLRACEK